MFWWCIWWCGRGGPLIENSNRSAPFGLRAKRLDWLGCQDGEYCGILLQLQWQHEGAISAKRARVSHCACAMPPARTCRRLTASAQRRCGTSAGSRAPRKPRTERGAGLGPMLGHSVSESLSYLNPISSTRGPTPPAAMLLIYNTRRPWCSI